ncbi:MAG: trypsin-like peptidase domain-containing protein [Opitutaceae bacterium]|jgi:serine protease Do|nr:trypsin-like peptidase domain-containing protein [Opitutaceae bacterium]
MTSPRSNRGFPGGRAFARAAALALAASVCLQFSTANALALGTIRLKSGASIQGEIIAERPDRVIIDLGFQVLSVPRDEIAALIAENPPGGAAGAADDAGAGGGDLFRAAPGQPALSVRENVERVGEAVVQIRTPTGLGSGFIIHPSGYVITNAHVISGEHSVSVTLFRRSAAGLQKVAHDKVRIVAFDPRLDLALLKIEEPAPAPGAAFPTVPLGDSNALTEGQAVFAIGSPLGLDRTVSQGIISSRNRPFGGQLYIQTTTQLNPGNSGGPLFNLRGEVAGVNNMKPMSAGIEGLNFAIPSAVVKNFLLNRDAFAFDARNPNSGFRYIEPPRPMKKDAPDAAPQPAPPPTEAKP